MIDVAITPASARQASVTVVIDAIRATSTIVQALAGDYRRVLCADSLDRARSLVGPGRVLAGEERCVPPPDFDLGNSPAGVTDALGEELILATTNGAPAIVLASRLSQVVLIGSLLNLGAVTGALAEVDDVQVLCAATEGRPSIEDTYVAGRIAAGLAGGRTDGALLAEAVARAYPSPLAALGAGRARRLLDEAGLAEDVEWCARESSVAVLPRVVAADDGLAIIALTDNKTPMSHEEHIAVKLSLG
jgi:2-phosphosulfolactate phosphatase